MKLVQDPPSPETERAALANKLRAMRFKRGHTTILLTKRCESERIVGKISKVSPSDTYCLVTVRGEGRRHIPLDDILDVLEPK